MPKPNQPTTPGSFRKEVTTAAKCRVNGEGPVGPRGGVSLAFGSPGVGSAPPLFSDQRRGSSEPAPRSRGAGSGMNSGGFCNLDVSKTRLSSFTAQKRTLPVPLITLRTTASFNKGGGGGQKRRFRGPRHLVPERQKRPRKRGNKEKQPAWGVKGKRGC